MRKARKTFTVTEDMVGKYINQHLYTDVIPVGKIVGIKSKTVVLLQPITATKNKTKMEFVVGGFAGHCVNQYAQDWDFEEYGEVKEFKIAANDRYNRISDAPIHYYDYNF
jgi:hypothetical protein